MLSAFAVGFAALDAGAAVPQAVEQPRPARAAAEGLKLAQVGDVEIFYDEFGRRVVVDAYTGEVLSVERPRVERRIQRRQLRRQQEERYYLDDPEDMARLRRERLRELGLIEPSPPIDDYEEYSRGDLPDGLDEGFAEPPRRAFPDEPEIIAREPIQRAPLDETKRSEPKRPRAAEPPVLTEKMAEPPLSFGAREDVAALQILLDRKGASPGVIDGKFGSNVDKAFVA